MNPFPYQRPVLPEQVIDRKTEVAQILDWCGDGMLIRLDAPRRYGKTSLVRRVFAEADNAGTVGILIDLKGVLTLADVIVRIGRGFSALRGPVEKALRPALSGIEAQFNVSFAGLGGGVRLTGHPANQEAALFALLDLPMRFAGKSWRRVIVCFDEFQDVLRVPAFDDKLRAAIQHHDDTVSYLFAGSEPRMMNKMFAEKNRAFWAQVQPLSLGPLAADDVAVDISRRFAETSRDIGEALSPLLRIAQGHPQRTMFLANKLWRLTPTGGQATLETWEAALAACKLQEEHALDAEWRSATPTEQRVLRAAALNDGHPYRKAAAASVGMPMGSVTKTVQALVDAYRLRLVERGRVMFVDPLFELYVGDLAAAVLPEAGDEEAEVPRSG
jgi:uncharacterized protein